MTKTIIEILREFIPQENADFINDVEELNVINNLVKRERKVNKIPKSSA